MTSATYQSTTPATMPPGLEVETEDVSGAKRQAVAVHMPGSGDPLQSEIVDIHGHIANVQAVTGSISGDEYGVITNAIIHGKSTAGGGAWVDVKVNPSGSLQVGGDVNVSDNGGSLTVDNSGTFAVQAAQSGTWNINNVSGTVSLPTGAATAANQTDGNQKAQIVDTTGAAMIQTGAVTGAKGLRVFIGPTDPVSDLPVFIDYNHHQNHEGEAYQYTYPLTALGNGVTLYFRLVVPVYATAIFAPHLHIEADVLAQTTVTLNEAPTTSANGTLQTSYNRNRGSTSTPGMTVYLSPTVTTAGTVLSSHTIGDATAGASDTLTFDEWILKSNTVYLVSVTANSAGDSVGLRFKWYEDLGV